MADETHLIRECAVLYASFALESFFTVIMGIIFSYLLLLITNKGRLAQPGKAMGKLVGEMIGNFWGEIYREVKKWPYMRETPLEQRFALCRKANQGICAFTVLIGILTLTRWAHFNNVNGFRYLGYCVTCPPKQAELVLLIAPVVPCYRVIVVITVILTAAMLIAGYGASVIPGDLYDGNLYDFIETWDWEALQPTMKMYWLIPSAVLLVWLSLIQIPLLIFWYWCKGGEKAGLPHGYVKLCAIVSLTWLAFPAWWLLSFEGASILKDTKLNAVGFAALNVLSKGSFTLHMLSMSAWHRNHKKRQEAISKGRRPSIPVSIFAEHHEPGDLAVTPDITTKEGSRRLARQETRIITILKAYEETPPVVDVAWATLEPTQRAYFLGNGITPASFNAMPQEKRQDLITDYNAIFDVMLDDKADELALTPPKTEVAVANLPKQRHLEPESASVFADKPTTTWSSNRQVSTAETRTSTISDAADSPGDSPLVGQKVTSVDGVVGRVLKVSHDEVQLSLRGGIKQTLPIEDLNKVVVSFTFLEGPEIAAYKKVLCTCAIEGRHASAVQTPLCGTQGNRVVMNHPSQLYGFETNDVLIITVKGRDETSESDVVIAEAKVEGGKFQDDGFESVVPLTLRGKALESQLGLIIFQTGRREPGAGGGGGRS